MNSCCSDISIPPDEKFVGCDGKKWSDDFLKYHIDLAVENENYEWAAECRDELKRRNFERIRKFGYVL